MCNHPRYHFQLNVRAFQDSQVQCLEVYAQCIECGEPMQFVGMTDEPRGKDGPCVAPGAKHAFLPFQVAAPDGPQYALQH